APKVTMAPVYRAVLVVFSAWLLGAGSSAAAQAPTSAVAGVVSVPAPDGQPFVVPGVTLTLICGRAEPTIEVSNERGEFRFVAVPAGACAIAAELQGFKTATTDVAVNAGETAAIIIQLGLETLHEEVTVTAEADADERNPIEA